jgi:heme-degrading monooxygenase HmoA
MLVRLWTTRVTPGREPDYLQFAQDRSRAMFLDQAGCLGVLFLTLPDGRHTACSFWRSRAHIEALAGSRTYQETANALGRSGILAGDQDVVVYEVEGGALQTDQLGDAARGASVDLVRDS